MISTSLTALLMSIPLAPAEVEERSLYPRTPAAIIVLTPFGQTSGVRISEIVESAANVFERETSLRLLSEAQSGIDVERIMSCPAQRRLSCWTAAADRLAYLLLVTIGRTEKGDLAAMTLLDLNQARAVMDAPDPEAAIAAFSINLNAVPLDRADELDEVFERAVKTSFRKALVQSGHYRPYGSIMLELTCPSCTLELKGKAARSSVHTFLLNDAQKVRLQGVPSGAYLIKLSKGSRMLCELDFSVAAKKERRLRAPAACAERAPAGVEVSSIVQWAGLGVFGAGAGLLGWSIALALNGPSSVCLSKSDGSNCRHIRLPRSGLDGHEGVAPADAVNRGLPVLSVGLGLALTGGAWALGSLLVEESLWWLPTVVGAVVGGVAFGASFGAGDGVR